MAKFGEYHLNSVLFKIDQYLYYDAFLEGDNNKYIIKCIKKSDQWDDDVAQLEHEYNLLLSLNEKFQHFPKVFEFVDLEKHSGIVFENENLITLEECYDKKNVILKNFFPLAISLAHAVSEIHSLNIIHKNLNPKCIFYSSEDLKVKVGDFSIATKLKRTMVPTAPPGQLQGSLEYMAPEQTGRMNRPLTLRADLYSLGIIFYEMLTGSVPYISDEPMKIIFGHIANVPQAPHKISDDIPPVLSDIVMKLLSKMAEDRYKSAIGLANDLEQAWSEFQKKKEIPTFSIGQSDIPTQLELPQKLYGRDEEIRLLETSFNELLKNSETKLIIVKGYSGIGKTSLIRELTQKVAIARGVFASGKFNKFQKSDSYEGLRQALDHVLNQYLTLPQDDYDRFKEDLIAHCGSLLSVIVDFIPRVKKIVGEQKPLPEVGIEQTKNRFELAIYQFLQVCSMNHPIVLFLDDLQWANNAMISMLEKFYLSKELKNVLMIISFRSNEVNAMHPLAIFLEKMEEKKPYTEIFLEGLGRQALVEILRDMLYLPAEEVESLAAVVERKTEGNPFFLLMLLEELYRDGELVFSSEEKRWVWDENRIVKIAASENVLDFVYRRLEKLPEESMETLHLAACIGHTFTLEELKLAQESSIDFILDSLKPAIKDGLIIPSNLKDEWVKVVKEDSLLNREYHFQHDKIHHSAYRKKTPEETKKMHLQLARHWYQSYKDKMEPNRLMSIADQYNKGSMYVVDESEKFLICELNHESGKLALDSVAYETAYLYDKMAKETIDPKNWDENYPFMFDVHLSFIKSSFMAHRYDESEKASEDLLEHANNNLDKAAILAAKGYLQRAQGRMEGNIPLFAEGLKLLNYESLGRDPNIFQVLYNIVGFKLKIKRNKKDFSNLPQETNAHQLLVYRLSAGIGEECYYQGNILRYAYVQANYFLKFFKNHSILTAYTGNAFYCVMWPRTHFAHELGKKVMKLLNEFENNEITSNIFLMMNSLHFGWHQPWKQITKLFQRSARHSMEVGNLEFAGISYLNVLLFDQTITCEKGKSELPKIADFISEISPRCYAQSKIYQQFYRNLCGDVPPNSWKTEDFDEDAELKLMERMHYTIGINKLMINKLRVALHYGDCSLVVNEKDFLYGRISKIKRANQPLDNLYSHLFVFMVETSQYAKLSSFGKFKVRLRLRSLHKTVKDYVKWCPENFEFGDLFMEAEYARILGQFEKSLDLYEETIRVTTELGFLEFVALCYQRILTLVLENEKHEIALMYAVKMIEAYEKWKAHGVVKVLEEKYAHLLDQVKSETEDLEPDQVVPVEDRTIPQGLDSRSVMMAADVIGKEIHLGKLISNVMQLLAENTGATKSALCLVQKNKLWVEGFFSSERTEIETLSHTPFEDASICQEVVQNSWRQEKEILIMDVNKEFEFSLSEYFSEEQTKSMLVVPIFKNQEVIGIIYCENNVSTNVFTEERIQIVRALALQMSISIENSRLYTTFERFVPKRFLNQLGMKHIFDIEQGDSIEKKMNVLFIDIRNFTGYSETHTAQETFKFINDYLSRVGPIIHENNGFIDKFIGDGVMALFPGESSGALNACIEIQAVLKNFTKEEGYDDWDLKVGMGLHYDSLMLGIVGETQHVEGTVIGDAVNVASRLDSFNKEFSTRCLMSDSFKRNLKNSDDYHLRRLGRVSLIGRKNLINVWQVFDVYPDKELRELLIETRPVYEKAYDLYIQRNFQEAKKLFQEIVEKNPIDLVAIYYYKTCDEFIENPPPDNWNGRVEMRVK